MRPLLILAILLAAQGLGAQSIKIDKKNLDLSEIRRLPLLEGTRYQPLDSVAHSWVEQVTRKQLFHDLDPVLVFLHWRFEPEIARKQNFIFRADAVTTRALGDEPDSGLTHISFDELANSKVFHELVAKAEERDSKQHTLIDGEVLKLAQRMTFLGMSAGIVPQTPKGYLPFIPPAAPPRPEVVYNWLHPHQLEKSGHSEEKLAPVSKALEDLESAYLANDGPAFTAASKALLASTSALGYPSGGSLGFPGMAVMDQEITLNRARPFQRATYIYFFGAFLALLAAVLRRFKLLWYVALLPTLGAFALQVWGMWHRTDLSNRAMIGTFYESVIFVAAIAAVTGLIFEFIYKSGWFHLAGATGAFAALFVATHNPHFMRPAISGLSAVLINNDWIYIHVPTIMAGYGVLAITILLSHVYLALYCFRGSQHPEQRSLASTMFWTIPIGAILLVAGIILGGVWADASWGRFWGWDPKEVGALILFLVFMVIVHGRWAGWLRDFGTAVGGIVGSFALGWSYYGTNFFWVGKHSYAEAGGGRQIPTWMWVFTIVELAVIAIAAIRWLEFKKTDPAASVVAVPSDATEGTSESRLNDLAPNS